MIEIKGFRGGGGRRRGDFKVKTNNSPGSENGINFRGRRDYWETRFIFIPHFISVLRKKPGDAIITDSYNSDVTIVQGIVAVHYCIHPSYTTVLPQTPSIFAT